jgi:acetate kinase
MPYVLTINSGSSSLKFSLYSMGQSEALLLSGEFDRIGLARSCFRAEGHKKDVDLPDHDAALHTLVERLRSHGPPVELDAVGHRLVYGGCDYDKPK